MYTDPTGHSAWSKFWDKAKDTVISVVATVAINVVGLLTVASTGGMAGFVGYYDHSKREFEMLAWQGPFFTYIGNKDGEWKISFEGFATFGLGGSGGSSSPTPAPEAAPVVVDNRARSTSSSQYNTSLSLAPEEEFSINAKSDYDPVGAALQVADYQESQELKRRLTWFEEVQGWLVEVGSVMERDHPYTLNMQNLLGFTGASAGFASNAGYLPRGIGISNDNFWKGGRSFYKWANQYGGGVKAMSAARLGAFSAGLGVLSAAMTGYTIGATIDSYVEGTREYIQKRKR